LFFNIALEKVVRETVLDIGGTILHKSAQILAHTEHAVTVQKFENAVKDAFNDLKWKRKKGVQ
jgi:hypothetical protein